MNTVPSSRRRYWLMLSVFSCGVIAGFLLGQSATDDRRLPPNGPRTGRQVPHVSLRDTGSRAESPEAQAGHEASTGLRPPATHRVDRPERVVRPDGLGRLEIDLAKAGTTSVEIEGAGFDGREEVSLETGPDGCVSISLIPGRYVIRWVPGGNEKPFAQDAVVLAAATTRVRLFSHPPSEDAAIPAGRCRVEVLVLDGHGSPLAGAPVSFVGRGIRGERKEVLVTCDSHGVANLIVRFEALQIQVGDQIEEVAVSNSIEKLTIRCTDMGIIRVPGLLEADVVVRSAGHMEWLPVDRYRIGEQRSGKDSVFVFLNPGRYELGLLGGARRAGEVRVGPGEQAVFSYEPPTGSIRVRFLAELPLEVRTRARAVLVDPDGEQAMCWPNHGMYWSMPEAGCSCASFPCLSRGHYRVRIELSGFELVAFGADVAEGTTEFSVPLVRTER